MSFSPTDKQREALRLFGGPATHVMLFGGSRSGKTFISVLAVVLRALAAPKSRHVILRFRFNAVKMSVVLDTFPKVMAIRFPGVSYKLDKTDWYVEFPNGSQIFFAGLDDKERTEKIFGMEFATVYFNESSQIPWTSRGIAITRLAQRVQYEGADGVTRQLRLKAYYDCNPPSQAHWTYKLFVAKKDPDTNLGISTPDDFVLLQINPGDNRSNLPDEYFKTLEALPARMRLRFMDGKFGDVTANALWRLEEIEKWRAGDVLPDMQRIIVAVNPSGSGDTDNLDNDAIGIVVAGLGMDGNGYLLENLTVKAGPATWGRVVASAYDRWRADMVVAEINYGGAMVGQTIKAARPGTPFKQVTASRGKAVRAEPISALAEQGKVRHVGRFNDLEEELCAFTTAGYLGGKSPNRADAYVWAFSELFPGMIRDEQKKRVMPQGPGAGGGIGRTTGWMDERNSCR